MKNSQFLGYSLQRTVRLKIQVGWFMKGLNGNDMYEDFRQTSKEIVCSQDVSLCVDGSIIIKKVFKQFR